MVPFLLSIAVLAVVISFVFSSGNKRNGTPVFDPEYARKWNAENAIKEAREDEIFEKYQQAIKNLHERVSSEPVKFDIKELPDDFDNVEFTAFDFETSNRSPLSAIALGIAHFRGNKLIETHEFKFSPVDKGEFEFTHIHGMTMEDVEHLPSFKDQIEEIFPHLNGRQLIAHNSDFDVDILKQHLPFFDKKFSKNRISCTYSLSKRFMRYESSYSLKNLCRNYKIPYENHHAAYDAVSAGVLFMHCLAQSPGGSVTEGAMRGKAIALRPIKIYHR